MLFTRTEIDGVLIADLEKHPDERGYFARTWCLEEFKRHGLGATIAQCSVSFNQSRGTLRGLHYQTEPFEEEKLVRCTRGAIFDVVLDVRTQSPTFGHWVGVDLSAENGRALFIPKGCAHGFQTLEDQSEVFYQISESYAPGYARGVRWNDPRFEIEWPLPDPILSQRDREFPDFVVKGMENLNCVKDHS